MNLYQHARNQFFHLFFFQMQSVLDVHAHPPPPPQKKNKKKLSHLLHEFVPVRKKSVNFICSFLRFSQLIELFMELFSQFMEFIVNFRVQRPDCSHLPRLCHAQLHKGFYNQSQKFLDNSIKQFIGVFPQKS